MIVIILKGTQYDWKQYIKKEKKNYSGFQVRHSLFHSNSSLLSFRCFTIVHLKGLLVFSVSKWPMKMDSSKSSETQTVNYHCEMVWLLPENLRPLLTFSWSPWKTSNGCLKTKDLVWTMKLKETDVGNRLNLCYLYYVRGSKWYILFSISEMEHGAPLSGSFPSTPFGNAITSLMLSAPTMMDNRRSIPKTLPYHST